MKKLMVMGAAVEQLPGIQKAKEMGYQVAAIDYNPNAVGLPLADRYYNVSTIDPAGVLNAAQDFCADGFLTLATDLPMRAVAYACEKLGLPGISSETALLATDKGEMIKALKSHCVESPWYFLVENYQEISDLEDQITFPCILKPVDNAASRGVVLVNEKKELLQAYEYSKKSSRNGTVIVEEYMVGPEVSVEILTYNGTPHVLQITDKITTGAPHFVELGHNQPSRLPNEIQERIKDVACRAVKALGINIGPAHVEMIVTDQGPKIVELGARLGGDCITSHLVNLSTGIDMVKETISVLCGGEAKLEPKHSKGAAIRFLAGEKTGVFDHIEGKESAKQMSGVVEITDIMQCGDLIESIKSSDDRVGYVIAQAETVEEAAKIAEQARDALKIVIRE